MDEVKKHKKHRLSFRNMNMRGTFFVYVIISFTVMVAASVATIMVVDNCFSTVAVYHIDNSEDVDRINKDDSEDVRFAVEIMDDDFNDSDAEAIVFYARNSSVALLLGIYVVTSVLIASQLFYSKKLKKPLNILETAAENISEKNLDFSLEYDKDDEMGKLVESFEAMRGQLAENNRELWNVISEQKRVQAVFAHDLRTPLTVTMGYVDILHEYLPEGKVSQEKLMETIENIRNNLVRIENFVTTMSNMQKMDDIAVQVSEQSVGELFTVIEEDCRMVCWDKRFEFSFTSDAETIMIDRDIAEQICANLVSNAARYAASSVNVECTVKDGLMIVTVQDDGNGFSEEALKCACDAYYSESSFVSSEHFGLGLNICKILCEKCSGTLTCANAPGGASVTARIPV